MITTRRRPNCLQGLHLHMTGYASNSPNRMKWLLPVLAMLLVTSGLAAESGSAVVVIYNSKMRESKLVAEHYAQKRNVPATQVLGFALPETEVITRADYLEKLERPLLKELESRGLFELGTNSGPSKGIANPSGRRVTAASIRYAALCYGVPLKIAPDPELKEAAAEQLEAQLRRNEASIDSQLTILPLSELGPPWTGPVTNPFFGTTNAAALHPTNGILLVTRLDGPTAEIARGLVDKALQAEAVGLWGRAYVDGRGITNGGYKLGDDMMLSASNILRRMGFETVMDEKPDTFSPGFPMSQIAFYAGWYDWNVSGPF